MKEKRKSERQSAHHSDITVFIEEDIYLANTIDISEGCIRFETSVPQAVRIQVTSDGEMIEYDAQLIWAKTNKKGGMEYGLKRFPDKNS